MAVDRPVKVENTCLLKAPVKMTSGLPPLVQIEDNTDFSSASVNAICTLASTRMPVPSLGFEGSAGEPAVPFDVLLEIQERIEAVFRGVLVLPAALAWLVSRMLSISRFNSRPLSISW